MAMSRKDYVAVAAILSDAAKRGTGYHSSDFPAPEETVMEIAKALADMFKADNSNFDRARFLAAAVSPDRLTCPR